MTRQDFVEMLKGLKGTTFATLYCDSEPKLKCPKTKNKHMQGRIRKQSTVNCTLGFIYANSVNRQRVREDKEGDFTPNKRKWGVRVPQTPLVHHNGNWYLETKVEKVYDTRYLLDGKVVDRSEIAEYLAQSSKQPQQELDKEVILRDYKVDSIIAATINGKQYVIDERNDMCLTPEQSKQISEEAKRIVYEDCLQNWDYLKKIVDAYVDNQETDIDRAYLVTSDSTIWPHYWNFNPETGKNWRNTDEQ